MCADWAAGREAGAKTVVPYDSITSSLNMKDSLSFTAVHLLRIPPHNSFLSHQSVSAAEDALHLL